MLTRRAFLAGLGAGGLWLFEPPRIFYSLPSVVRPGGAGILYDLAAPPDFDYATQRMSLILARHRGPRGLRAEQYVAMPPGPGADIRVNMEAGIAADGRAVAVDGVSDGALLRFDRPLPGDLEPA